MVERALAHRRTHNLLLLQKLLSVRSDASPFTLILDTVEQGAGPLAEHYIQNATAARIEVVFVSYETLKPPAGVTRFIKARRKEAESVRREILAATGGGGKRTLLIIDTLHPLSHPTTVFPPSTPSLPAFLSSLITPSTTLLAAYHTDIPLPPASNPYSPTPLTTLSYLATSIFRPHSFPQVLAKRKAQERSLEEPVFGLAEEREGVVIGKGANGAGMGGRGEAGRGKGIALEMEHRRKSGRGVHEMFFLPKASSGQKAMLLDDHPLYRGVSQDVGAGDEGAGQAAEEMGSTFELGLTEKQRRDREGVVLPYFDAQMGGGEGGRILYDLGVEDDFDEEEDEI